MSRNHKTRDVEGRKSFFNARPIGNGEETSKGSQLPKEEQRTKGKGGDAKRKSTRMPPRKR